MSKYINADEFISYIDAGHYVNPCVPFFSENGVVEMIKEFKGIDIVKCKDCKYFKPHENTGFCDKAVALLGELNPDNYCSYGERKETE